MVPLCLLLLLASSLAQHCGKRKVPNFLIVNGTESKDGYWPWHAAIFRRGSKSFDYTCGGTILDHNTVLTAGHCVKRFSREHIRVQIGRSTASTHVQEHEAEKFIVHPNYRSTNRRHNIALIKLATDIIYTDYIQPICLWNRGEDQNAIVGSFGTVVGFGIDETDNPSNTLREANLLVVSTIACIERNSETFGNLLNSGMFCAGNRDAIGPFIGDDGGGFFFNYNDVWFIRGVVSITSHIQGNYSYNTTLYTVFTDVAKYLRWIEPKIEQFIASSLSQKCGKWKFHTTNSHTYFKSKAKNGYCPWHAAIFRRGPTSFEYACGGTILDRNTILTVATCLTTSEGNIVQDRIIVQVGRSRLFVTSTRAQEHEASEIIIHPEYVNFVFKVIRYDIALIKLANNIIYTDYIQPICLWDRSDDQNSIIGSLGTVVGYGIDGTANITDTLREARIPVVSTTTCMESNWDAFYSADNEDVFCAGNTEGTKDSNVEAGGGFFFNYKDGWYIRGVAIYTPPRQSKATSQYTVFTDVAQHLKWIKSKIDSAQTCGKRKVPNYYDDNGNEDYWPWHVAISLREFPSLEYVCGGTILDQNTVLTAAHCLMTSTGIIPRERLVVEVGRSRLRIANTRAQEHKASELIVHPHLRVDEYRHNIALIKLCTNITFSYYIKPICLWNRGEDQNAIIGSLGTEVRYGLDDPDFPSNALQEARILVVSAITCIESGWRLSAKYLTSDMLCAGNRDGIGPCNGDAGGGLFFNYNNVWYIRGVVSFRPSYLKTGICDAKHFTLFTDVPKYLKWIEPKIELEVASSLSQNCGKRKVPNFLIVNGTESKEGYWPWHAAIFRRDFISFDYACGGTILDQNTVLTAAHCLMASEGIIAQERLVVQVGRNRLYVASIRAQEYKAFQLIVHPNFKDNGIRHDIGLIKLATEITYTEYIQPICLWNRDEDQNAIVGSMGTVIGFGIDETDNPSNTLREARLPVVSTIVCIESNRDTFATQLTSEMFCAGSRDGVSACNGDSGGGMFFNFNDVWYIRGLVSFTKPQQNSYICDSKEYTVFTDVAKYLKWIEEPVGLAVASRLAQSCGKRKIPNFHTNNGTESKDGCWPWFVEIFHNNALSFVYTCGGTILDQNTVLTAAHCLMASEGIISPERLVVQVRRNQIRMASTRAQEHGAFELIVHPEYSVNRHRHDIALIKLAADITFTDYIQPICLWDRSDDQNAIIGSMGTVIGYGTDDTDNTTDTLREVRIPIVGAKTCFESNLEAFASDMFCAGNREGIRTSNGEDGGGLFFNYSNSWFLRGVASSTSSRQNKTTKEYTLFTDVAKHLEWIKKHMRETSGRLVETGNYYYRKLRLLPMSTCGANPYASREESSKPVLLGYPWVGLLEYNQTGSHKKIVKCQATLINDLYLITIASCISSLPRRYTLSSVRLGEYNKNTTTDCAEVDGQMVCSPPVQSLRIESVTTHPANSRTQPYANNIALIRLRDQADTSRSNVKPICLPVTYELRSQKSTHYTLTSWVYGSSGNLLERSVREFIDSIECQKLYNDRLVSMEITTRHICIRQQQENDSECKLPTSGAPIQLVQQVQGKSRYVLYGVLSHGPRKCGLPYPDVYTSVANNVDWILENIQE